MIKTGQLEWREQRYPNGRLVGYILPAVPEPAIRRISAMCEEADECTDICGEDIVENPKDGVSVELRNDKKTDDTEKPILDASNASEPLTPSAQPRPVRNRIITRKGIPLSAADYRKLYR